MGTLKQHKGQCKLCKDERLAEIEEEYLSGASQAEIVRKYMVDKDTLSRHVRFLELDKKRDNSTLAIVNRMCANIDWRKLPVKTLRNAVELLTLRSKLLGEVVQKHEVKEVLDDLSNEQLAVLAEQSARIIDQRTVDNADQGDGTAKIPS